VPPFPPGERKTMRLEIKVKPNSKTAQIVQNDDGTLTVRVTSRPIEGKANAQVIELLSEYFHKPKRAISIVAGLKGKLKIIQIL
jgi:uncharacterized protein (TIGR00251 family)